MFGDYTTNDTLYRGVDHAPSIFEVGELSRYIGGLLASDPTLQEVWLRGEVSNVSRSPAGHYYFCLKDETSQLRCVLFRGHAARSQVLPSNGQSIVAHGQVRFYERQGTCELVADLLFPEGIGLAQMQFEALYRRLEAEGLFDQARKRALPRFPRRIGIISSDGGAVIHDLLTVLGRRYPIGEVLFLPTPVQGDAAASAIVGALQALGNWTSPDDGVGVDLVVVARGGGSAEDLATFNDERVVRAIFASRAPVVSAIGHETDTTLADLVADLRAPTPSAAAEMVVPDLTMVRREVLALRMRGWQSMQNRLAWARSECRTAREALASRLAHRLRVAREQVAGRRFQLAALSPEATLRRGYAVAEIGGCVVRQASEVTEGQSLTVRLHRGRIDSTVSAVHPT
jgi:exodeoxyribonuclease VII large subunit